MVLLGIMGLHSGVREIYIRRIRSAWMCSVLHQVCILVLYLALMNTDPLHPTKWVTSCITNMISLKTLAFLSFMTVVTFLQVIFFCKQLTFNSSYNSTRLKAVLHVFALDNIFSFLLHLLIGFAMGYMYITIENNPVNPRQCTDDELTFKVLCTTFTAVYIFVQNCLGELSYIQFQPLPGLPAKMQVKQNMKDCVQDSLWPALKAFIYFNVVYYFCGAWMGQALYSLPGIGKTSVEFHSIFQLLQMWRLLSSYMLCSIVCLILTTMKAVTQTSLASRWKFAITGDEGQLVLCEALSLNNMPFIQQLASQDLVMVAESDPPRRAELYTLSQPGGHPHNWKNILKHFLNLVDQMCTELSCTTLDIPKPVPVVEEIHFPTSPGMRNMAFESPMMNKSYHPDVPPSCTSVSSKARTWLQQQLDLLLKKPPVAFVFGERTDTKIAHALTTKGQTLAYLVNAITTIAQASVTEDSYGVVQQDLANIIVAIFKLKSAVDKLGSVCRKQNRPQPLSSHLNIKSILRESTVQGIYKIIITFKNHLDDVNLPQDLKVQLQSFKQFKET